MRTKIIYTGCVLFMLAFCMSCRKGPALPPLQETYAKKDQDPFGTFMLFRQLEELYFKNTIHVTRNNFARTWQEISDTSAVYINVSKNLFLTKEELTAMLEYVYNGNTMFISSDRIDRRLLDTLGCSENSGFFSDTYAEMKNTAVKLEAAVYGDSTAFRYFYLPFYNHFSKYNKSESVVIGHNNYGPNCLLVFHGKGRFYLHTEPRALSNYFLLQRDNYKYAGELLSFTPDQPEHVYWDDYYNKRSSPIDESGESSGLSVLLQYPAMKWAFWLLLSMLLLYILFGGKRRQRIVTPFPANTNTTVAFTETIGRLYLQKKDNRNIADKLITYLLEHIRNQHFMNTNQVNEEFIQTLSRKTNSSNEGVTKLFDLIKTIQQSADVSDQELLLLNQRIEHFYKNKL